MASSTTSNGIKTSFANTPQAADDGYSWTEDALQASGILAGNIITLDVMSNDAGGNAKTLFAIDDGNGNTSLTDYDLLNADSNGVWETTGSGDLIRIYNGKVQVDISHSLAALGASSVNALGAGDHIHDEFVYAIRLANGTLSQARVTIDITGQNDAAVISGSHNGNIVEDTTLTASGTLTVVDPDHGQSHTQSVIAASHNSNNHLGSYSVDADGHWSYTVDNSLIQHLAAGVHASDSFTVTSLDGTASQQVNIDIVGVNDMASISGHASGSVTEDTTLTAAGTLTVSDVDDGEAHTQTVAAAHNSVNHLGSYSVDADGHWSYTVDNSLIQHLAAGAHASDSFTVTSLDGTASRSVMIDIVGANDPASFVAGGNSGSMGEDDTTAASGVILVNDVDDGENHTAAASGVTALGSTWSIDAAGHWSYTLNNAAVQHLGATASTSDSFAVTSQDGTASEDVTITINGANDPASFVAGGNSGSMGEDDTAAAGGVILVNDVDDGENHTAAASGITALGSTWSIDAAGHWSYTLNSAAVQHLGATASTSDTFTVTSQDGTASEDVTITINGANDPASFVAGGNSGSMGEDDTTVASGIILVNDVDDGENHTAAASGITALGSTWSIDASGHWSYTLNNAAVHHLGATASTSDSFAVTSQDGTASEDVTITINGANDPASFVAGGNSGSMGEDDTTAASGVILVSDVDDGENHTAAAGGVTALGSTWSIDATGHWSYTLNNAAVQNLNVGNSTTDSFTISSADGSVSESVTITINGSNDPATITGTASGSVVEAGAGNGGGAATATGTLHDSDVDNNPNSFQAVATATVSDNGYGTFTIQQNGKWTYTLDNTNSTVDALNTGQSLVDTFTVHTADGTAQQVSITINGVTDDLGGPTGITFTMNAGANNANNLGTFTETGDPDNANDVYTWSVGAGSSSGFNVSGGTLNASGVVTGADNILNLVVTDQAGHTAAATYHVWIGTNGADNFSFAALGDNGTNIGDGMGNADTITGGSSTDYLLGDNGADTLIGGGGADQLAGGGGADIFKYTAVSDSTPASHDTILDFNATGGQHDFIAFQNSLGLTTFDGALAGTTIAAGHVGWKVVGSETVVYANTSGATETLGATNMEIHLSGASLGLTASDFLLHA